jgi:hypothetical protein
MSGGSARVTAPGQGNVNHNTQSENLFTLLSKAGLTWRSHSASMNPGHDPRPDSIGDAAVVGTYVGAGSDDLQPCAVPNARYKIKHRPAMACQAVRNLPEIIPCSQRRRRPWARCRSSTRCRR